MSVIIDYCITDDKIWLVWWSQVSHGDSCSTWFDRHSDITRIIDDIISGKVEEELF